MRQLSNRTVFAIAALMSAALVACSTNQPPTPLPPAPANQSQASLTGVASWYGPGFDGHRTASGEVYNQEELTAASTVIPLGSHVMVTNLDNGRSVEVRINDHGP